MSLDNADLVYGDGSYPWAIDFWLRAQQMHWLGTEVPMGDDARDYRALTPAMRSAIDKIFLFFVQSDVEVFDCYHDRYARIFKPVPVKMMLTKFSEMETVHIHAYRHLLDTLGIGGEHAHAFKSYKEMRDKSDWFQSFQPSDPMSVAKTMVAVSGFGEGLFLFASFALLLTFPRNNLMKGMGQIVSWSVRDETLHCEGIIRLLQAYLQEHPEIDRRELRAHAEAIADEAVVAEDHFIDLVWEGLDDDAIPGITKTELKRYTRFIANLRLRMLGFSNRFPGVDENPLPWVDAMQSAPELANFFETRATEYTKAATRGEWDDEAYDVGRSVLING